MSDLKLTLRNGIYQVTGTVKVPGQAKGVRVRESAGTARLRDAEVYRDRLRQEVIDRATLGAAHDLTVADCAILYIEKGGEKRFLRPIIERFGDVRVRNLEAGAVSAFAQERFGHLSPASVKRFYYTPLNALLRRGCKEHRIAPISFEAPKVERAPVEEAPDDWFGPFFQAAHLRIAATVLFLTSTAARVSETCRLTPADCDFERGRAVLRRTKSGRSGLAVFDARLGDVMRRLIEVDGTGPHERLFGYSNRWSVNQAIERVCAKAGLRYYSSHKLGRHSFAARFLASGGSLLDLQGAGRWASIQVVADTYGHLEHKTLHASIRDMGSQVAGLIDDTRLTHATHQQRRRRGGVADVGEENQEVGVVGATGIEPVTPTMSR